MRALNLLVVLWFATPAWATAAPRAVSLADVRTAVAKAPERIAAHHRTVTAAAEVEAAGAWPTTSLSLATARESPRLVAVASVPVPITGARRAARATARALAEVARAEADTIDLDLRLRATIAWLDLYGAGQTARIKMEASERLDALVVVTRARRDAGDASDAEVVNAEAQAARAHVEADDAARSEGIASAELAGLLGWDPSEALMTAGGLPTPDSAPDTPSLRISRHPVLRVQEARVAEADAAIAEARAAGRPDVHVNFEVDTLDPRGAPTDVRVGLAVDLPFGGRGRARVHAAGARLRAEQAEADAVRSQLTAELVAAQRRWAAARQRATSFTTAIVPAQERSSDLVRKAYAAGEVELASVIQSERDLLDVRAESLAADIAAAEAWTALERAVGGNP